MTKQVRYLEPIYLNTSMVLNAAGYLFGGAAVSDERTETTGKEREGKVKAGVPFLDSVLGLGAEARASQTLEVREVREITVGGLHMNVLDALRGEKALSPLTTASFEGFELELGTYVETRVLLRPVEYHSILRLVQVVAPIVGQAGIDFPAVRQLFNRPSRESEPTAIAATSNGSRKQPKALATATSSAAASGSVTSWKHYSNAAQALADSLEKDFRRSQELEVVLDDPSTGDVFGVASLNLDGYEVDQLRARITDIEAIVIGKVTRFASHEENLPLLQQTAIMQLVELVRKVAAAAGASTPEIESKIEMAKAAVHEVIPLRVSGPAVRLAAMSICI